MQTNSADSIRTIASSQLLPAKRPARMPLFLSVAIILAAVTSFTSGWIIRGLDTSKNETRELTIAVKSALTYAEAAREKDVTIARLTEYCVAN